MRVNMLRYTIARESPSDVFAPEAGGTYQLGDFDCIADPVTLIAKPRGNYASEYEARLALEPHLQSWSAKAELVDRIPMSFHFVGSELADRRPQPDGGDATDLVVFDAVSGHALGLSDPDQGDRGPSRSRPALAWRVASGP